MGGKEGFEPSEGFQMSNQSWQERSEPITGRDKLENIDDMRIPHHALRRFRERTLGYSLTETETDKCLRERLADATLVPKDNPTRPIIKNDEDLCFRDQDDKDIFYITGKNKRGRYSLVTVLVRDELERKMRALKRY